MGRDDSRPVMGLAGRADGAHELHGSLVPKNQVDGFTGLKSDYTPAPLDMAEVNTIKEVAASVRPR